MTINFLTHKIISGFGVLLSSVILLFTSTPISSVLVPTKPQPRINFSTSTTSSVSSSTVSTPQKTAVKKVVTTSTTTRPPDVVPEKPREVYLTLPATPILSSTELNEKIRAATVNIFCTTSSGGAFHPITGTGVVIDKRGVILTNAHVGQYFLLRTWDNDDFVSCIVRTGSPAVPRYYAELMYISSRWIEDNAASIVKYAPTGNGRNDYALLRITKPVDPAEQLPNEFPFIEFDTSSTPKTIGEQVFAAAYPAELIGEIAAQSSLWLISSPAQIRALYHFGTTTRETELISIGGPIISQAGASGGPVIDTSGKLLGIIALETSAKTTSEKQLFAVTIPHIDTSLYEETGRSFRDLLLFDPARVVADFNETRFNGLKQLLIDQIPH